MDLKGKKVVFLGDSITAGVGTTADENRYWEIIARESGAICKGYGISGTRIAKKRGLKVIDEQFEQWFNSRVDDMDDDADVVVVFGGTNDFGHGEAALGSIDDTTEETFYGALNVLYTHLLNKYPTARIIVITPTHRLEENRIYNEVGVRNMTNLCGYVNIIKEVAGKYSLPVIDFYNELGVNPIIEKQKEIFMPDGLHPSDKGNERMAEFFLNKIATF